MDYKDIIIEYLIEFNDSKELDKKIEKSIKIIGEYMKISRIILCIDNDFKKDINIFEWLNDSISSDKENILKNQLDKIDFVNSKLKENGYIIFDNIENIEGELFDFFSNKKIKSLVMMPIYCDNEYRGYLSLQELNNIKSWNKDDIEIVKIFISIIQKNIISSEKIRNNKDCTTKNEILSTMSHDLRTPLNAISGFSELLIKKIPQESDLLQYVIDINKSGKVILEYFNCVFENSGYQNTIRKKIILKEQELNLDIKNEINRFYNKNEYKQLIQNIINYSDELIVSLSMNKLERLIETIKELYDCTKLDGLQEIEEKLKEYSKNYNIEGINRILSFFISLK